MAESFDIVGEEHVNAVLDSFGGLRPMAKKMGVGVSTVQGWKQRNKIPANRLQDIDNIAKKHNLILPDSFYKALQGDPSANPNTQDGANDIKIDNNVMDDEPINDAEMDMAMAMAEQMETDISVSDNDRPGGAIVEDAPMGSKKSKTAAETAPADSGHGHGPDAADLPKSTAAHWALLLAFVAILAVITRPLWADGIDRKLQAKIGGHGETDTHGTDDGHGDDGYGKASGGEIGVMLEQLKELQTRVSTVEQANANLALLSFNFQQETGSNVFGSGEQGMSAEELKKLEDARLDLEILKKESVTKQVQIDSVNGLLNQLEENTRLMSRRLENVELESGQLFERNFSRSIGLFYALESLDARIRDGLAFDVQLERFDDLSKNTEYRDDIINDINLLRQNNNAPILALPILASRYSDFLYPLLVRKTDSESRDWKEQVAVRVRSLVQFKKQEQVETLNDLLRAEYLLHQGRLAEALQYASPDILQYGKDTPMVDWLADAQTRHKVLTSIDSIRNKIDEEIVNSIRDLRQVEADVETPVEADGADDAESQAGQ